MNDRVSSIQSDIQDKPDIVRIETVKRNRKQKQTGYWNYSYNYTQEGPSQIFRSFHALIIIKNI